MCHRTRCLSTLAIVVGLGVGAITWAQEPTVDQAAQLEAARLEVREVRQLANNLASALEAELVTRLNSVDPALAVTMRRSLEFQHQHIEGSWQAAEALPPQFLPALATQAQRWKPVLEQQLSRIRAGLELSTRVGSDAAIKRAAAPIRSPDACNAARSEDSICRVTPAAECFNADSLACIDFCGALLGAPITFKALAGDEMEVSVAGFGFNFSSPFAIIGALVLHIAQILCNVVECGVDVTNECTRNEIRELIEQQHRHINDFDLDAATQELLTGLGANTGNALAAIESNRVLSAQLDARLASEQEFVDDSELFRTEQDLSRDLFAVREQLCTLEALLYRPLSDHDQVPANCGADPEAAINRRLTVDAKTTQLVLSLMKEGRELPSLYLPESEGGLLELVRHLAIDAARASEGHARESLTRAEQALHQRKYREAYRLYCQAVGGAS